MIDFAVLDQLQVVQRSSRTIRLHHALEVRFDRGFLNSNLQFLKPSRQAVQHIVLCHPSIAVRVGRREERGVRVGFGLLHKCK